jgi:predicted dehydrogenase
MTAMSTAPRSVRVGLVGYGLAGRVFHAPLIAATKGLTLAAVVTKDKERRARLATEHPRAVGLDAPEALFEKSLALDLVVVATPNRSHVPLAQAALEAGLNVVVDKPFAPTSNAARALAATARARGLVLSVFQNRRLDGDFLTVRKLMSEGALGTIHRFESRFERYRPTVDAVWRESGDADDAGGVLFDLGSHLIDQALVLFGGVRTVFAEVLHRRAGSVADDDAFVALEHLSGVRSHLWMSKVVASSGPRFRVVGDEAVYTKFGLDGQEPALAAGALPGSKGFGEEPSEQWGTIATEGGSRTVPTELGSYPRFYEGMAAALLAGAPVPVDPLESIAGLELIEAARASATNGRVERIAG